MSGALENDLISQKKFGWILRPNPNHWPAWTTCSYYRPSFRLLMSTSITMQRAQRQMRQKCLELQCMDRNSISATGWSFLMLLYHQGRRCAYLLANPELPCHPASPSLLLYLAIEIPGPTSWKTPRLHLSGPTSPWGCVILKNCRVLKRMVTQGYIEGHAYFGTRWCEWSAIKPS